MLLACAVPATAGAVRIPVRTELVDAGSAANAGNTKRPILSDDGRWVAYDTSATAEPGAIRDVYLRRVGGSALRLVSAAPGRTSADGPSVGPALSADGRVIAFESDATNLVAGDVNRERDVFVRIGSGPVLLASAGMGGQAANGPSSEVDLDAAGHFAVFTSEASNLVPGDTNGVADVFLRDLRAGTTVRVSQTAGEVGGDGPSRTAAISPDGGFVSFASEAANLLPGDARGLPDVFLKDLSTGAVRRVSVSSREKAQNDAVQPPFVQVSDVSRGGRFVVFDSDATNLVKHDERGHTDVFVRDTRRGTTSRVSVARGEANSDSVYPRITPNGRFVTFESFASNLFVADAEGPDSFLYDRRLRVTTLLDVTNAGKPKRPHRVTQVLQRPSVSADGNMTAFTSRAALVADDVNGRADAYLRRTAPPKAHIRYGGTRYRVTVDDPDARLLYCRFLNVKLQGFCKATGSLAFLAPGRYALSVRPWGGGMRMGDRAILRFRR